jgi:mitogen-activated protein kinase 1/3
VVDERYEIIKQVGSGAYGVVASALDRQRNKKVAIKKVRPSRIDRLSMLSKISLMQNAS